MEFDLDFNELMVKLCDYDEFLWGWKSWRDVVGFFMRLLYEKFVGFFNFGVCDYVWGDYGNF